MRLLSEPRFLAVLLVCCEGACSNRALGVDTGESPDGPATQTDGARCASPQQISLEEGRLELTDETITATDEFPELDCGSRGAADTLKGPQRYYELRVTKGHQYNFALTPSFHAIFYGFDKKAACSVAALAAACRSDGRDGFASGLINPGTGNPGATVFAVPPPFTPDRDMALILVVDSDDASAGGSFILRVTEN